MPSHVSTDRSTPQPPRPGSVDGLIDRTRRLRGDVDAVRRHAEAGRGGEDDPHGRWRRALYDLAVHQLDDLRSHLDQLREGLPDADDAAAPDGATGRWDPHHPDHTESTARTHAGTPYGAAAPGRPGDTLLSRVGTAEWNLLTDEVHWSDELYRILGRAPESGPMTLDELPSVVFAEDQSLLTAMVTGCLVDGRPIDGEFRMVRTDGRVRTVHMTAEPVLDTDGSTAAMWAVLRDVSELRRSERAVRESRDVLHHQQHRERAERRAAVGLQEAVLPPWRGTLTIPTGGDPGRGGLDVAVRYLPSTDSALIGGDWYDATRLPSDAYLLCVGDLTGHGVAATSTTAMLLGAVRALAVAGFTPGPLLGHLNRLVETAAQPTLGSAVCCRVDPVTGAMEWAQAGHPAPLLFRAGAGRPLRRPEGVLLGATEYAEYEQADERLAPGDLLVLHTDGLTRLSPADDVGDPGRLLALAPRLAGVRDAEEAVRLIVAECDGEGRGDDACVLVARVPSGRI
ncbi:PP2C family protein-serine/threonine phosphatase [Streptomyces sp. NPDC057638]|uniref:PP2C family protein-serine/threonine phosphatase n=1 Tax=Streptomyces sp. NPDC057638 TaxID=3346190 RepID=UPI003699F18A